MKNKTGLVNYLLPAHWSSYLVNNDASGFSAKDIEVCQSLLRDEKLGSCLTCSDESNFCKSHDATKYGVLACNCLTYTFPKLSKPQTPDKATAKPLQSLILTLEAIRDAGEMGFTKLANHALNSANQLGREHAALKIIEKRAEEIEELIKKIDFSKPTFVQVDELNRARAWYREAQANLAAIRSQKVEGGK